MKKRNGEIEILRMGFTFIVLIFHSLYVSNGQDAPYFYGGWLGVEFFFLVSGYLMAAHEDTLPPPPPRGETFRFLWRKIKGIYPYFIFAIITNFFVWSIPLKGNFFTLEKLKSAGTALLNLIFPYSLGFKGYFYLGYSWYLSAMLYSMMILYPLLRHHKDAFYDVIAPLTVAFGLGFYSYRYSGLGQISQNDYILSAGLVRGLAEISMGCLCYMASKKLKSFHVRKAGAYLLTLLECLCILLILIRIIWMPMLADAVDFVIFFLMAVVVVISFSEKSITTFQIDGKIAGFFAKFSLALYINSNCWSYLTARLWPQWSYWKATGVYILFSLGAAFSCMAICGWISKLWSIWGNRIIGKLVFLEEK